MRWWWLQVVVEAAQVEFAAELLCYVESRDRWAVRLDDGRTAAARGEQLRLLARPGEWTRMDATAGVTSTSGGCCGGGGSAENGVGTGGGGDGGREGRDGGCGRVDGADAACGEVGGATGLLGDGWSDEQRALVALVAAEGVGGGDGDDAAGWEAKYAALTTKLGHEPSAVDATALAHEVRALIPPGRLHVFPGDEHRHDCRWWMAASEPKMAFGVRLGRSVVRAL